MSLHIILHHLNTIQELLDERRSILPSLRTERLRQDIRQKLDIVYSQAELYFPHEPRSPSPEDYIPHELHDEPIHDQSQYPGSSPAGILTSPIAIAHHSSPCSLNSLRTRSPSSPSHSLASPRLQSPARHTTPSSSPSSRADPQARRQKLAEALASRAAERGGFVMASVGQDPITAAECVHVLFPPASKDTRTHIVKEDEALRRLVRPYASISL
ncbi:hypothetical protein CERSUDRAFT_94628 [Gelatoporia subvermispora B]|uniref:Uncharacterized protein n=1 Tax=Ceriporiopsis subvermispora (strain B) TaxID=914234 RepID=M2RFN2_CERS8|nr:hypothetical protein CERSUDRAFT_94628 [Gelatoporia subvermispora B]